jgi:chromosome partitioning protein
MPVISFISTKGGAGKTTAAAILASVLADNGASVALLDIDPNQPLMKWSSGDKLPVNLEVFGSITDENIIDKIE